MKFIDCGNFSSLDLTFVIIPDLSSAAFCFSVAVIFNCAANRSKTALCLYSSSSLTNSPSDVIISGNRLRKACLL